MKYFKRIIPVIFVFTMMLSLFPTELMHAAVDGVDIPQGAIEYAEKYYMDAFAEGTSLFDSDYDTKRNCENPHLGKPFVIYETESDTQDEIYYFPILDKKEEVVLIMSVMGTTDGWRCCFSEEWIDILEDKANREGEYYRICNNVYSEEEVLRRKVKTWTTNALSTRIINAVKNNKHPRFLKADQRLIGNKDVLNKKYSPDIEKISDNGKKCKLYNQCGQAKYGLCWAASVGTICNYRNGTSINAKQIADRMRIGYDDGGTTADIKNALKEFGVDYPHDEARVLSYDVIKNNINQKYPISISARTYSGIDGHVVTIYGYQYIPTSKKKYILFWNSGNLKTERVEYDGKSTYFTYNNKDWVWKRSVYKK